jgi:hypothetical protein
MKKTKAEKAKLLKDLTTGKARLADLREYKAHTWFVMDGWASSADCTIKLPADTFRDILAEREKAEADPSYKPLHIEGAEMVGYGTHIIIDFC